MGNVLNFERGYGFIEKTDMNTFEIRLQETIPAQSFVVMAFRVDESHERVRFQQSLQNIQEFKTWLENGGEFKSRHYIMHLSIDNGVRTISVINQWPTAIEFVLGEDDYERLKAAIE